MFRRTAVVAPEVAILVGMLVASWGCASHREQLKDRLVSAVPSQQLDSVDSREIDVPERTLEIGRTVEGAAIQMHLFGDHPHPVLILGGIHGSERNSAECVQHFLEYVRGHRAAFRGIALAVISDANPDGLARGVRYNARRVDLNRNFPASNWVRNSASGRSAGSEPETRALVGVVNEQQPCRILSIHSIMGDPCNNFDGPADALATVMASENGYPVKGNIGYPTPGSLGSWAGHDLNIPIVTLELPFVMSGTAAWERNRTAILGFARFSQNGANPVHDP